MNACSAERSPFRIKLLGLPDQRASSAAVPDRLGAPPVSGLPVPDSLPTDQGTRSDCFPPPSAGTQDEAPSSFKLGCLLASAYFPL